MRNLCVLRLINLFNFFFKIPEKNDNQRMSRAQDISCTHGEKKYHVK